MKVKYNGVDETGSYITGKEYQVITVIFDGRSHRIAYRLIPEDYIYSVIENSEEFTISDYSIPSDWILNVLNDHYAELTPKVWSGDEFWPNFYDGCEMEMDIYREEIKRMCPEDNELHQRLNEM